MIDDYEERKAEREAEIARREAQAVAGHPEGTRLVRCYYEQLNPGETCPVCSDEELKGLPEFGAADSERHGVEVRNLLELRRVTALETALESHGFIVMPSDIGLWGPDEVTEVQAWLRRLRSIVDDPASTETDLHAAKVALPGALGRPHVVGDTITSEAVPGDTYICCTTCGARLFTRKTGDAVAELPVYPAGTRVGTDCPGAEAEPARQIARRRGRVKDKK